jgi:methylthioribose-1-phosphate isomerase
MAAYEAVGELSEDGDAIADAMLAAAERFVADATDDHGRLITVGLTALDALPRPADGPLRLLVHGPSGTLAGGQAGTALAIAIAAHHAERQVRVVVPEGRPRLAGARVTCWELAAAGVPYLLIADAAAPSLIAAGEVDAILVTADRVAANGDVGAAIGTYGLAVTAARHGVPVLACAPATAIDPGIASGEEIVIASRPTGELDRIGDVAIAPRGTEARVPLHDVTPAELVTSFVTGDGLHVPPFVGAKDEAVAAPAADVVV